jgi:hypothetical protein
MRELLDLGEVTFDCAACAPAAADDRPDGETAAEAAEAALPAFSWAMFDRQLRDLAGRPELQQIVRPLLRSLRARAPGMSADAVLRELLCLTWVVMEEPPPQAATRPR